MTQTDTFTVLASW